MTQTRSSPSYAFGTAQWLAWLGALVLATASIVVFAYAQFETKETAQLKTQGTNLRIDEHAKNLDARLDRIEKQLDVLLER